VTQKSLTATLRRLERNGMVERIVTSTRPVAVEYRITPLGRSLQDLIDALLHWTTVTLPDVERARACLRWPSPARGPALPVATRACRDGLGVQLVGRRDDEEHLLAVAAAVERAICEASCD
jgi:DNA-binding MarR family transcriptional regulator